MIGNLSVMGPVRCAVNQGQQRPAPGASTAARCHLTVSRWPKAVAKRNPQCTLLAPGTHCAARPYLSVQADEFAGHAELYIERTHSASMLRPIAGSSEATS